MSELEPDTVLEAESERPSVWLNLPISKVKGLDLNAYIQGVAWWSTRGEYDVLTGVASTSLLPYTFNLLWAGFLNAALKAQAAGCEYVAMLHDDICPESGWLKKLVHEAKKHNADFMSVIVPIKDQHGLTSTALESSDPWGPRRLTMREVYELPETFTHEQLLVNSGCWVCRVDAPWIPKPGEQDPIHFRQHDKMEWNESLGEWQVKTFSEDWDFSRQINARGGMVWATRAIKLTHEFPQYHNRHPWGDWAYDVDAMRSEGELTEITKLICADSPQNSGV